MPVIVRKATKTAPPPLPTYLFCMEKMSSYDSNLPMDDLPPFEPLPPPPPALIRQTAEEFDTKVLDWDCGYAACKYQKPTRSWGWILANDYDHFLTLVTYFVGRHSRTFQSLKAFIKPEDIPFVDKVVENVEEFNNTQKGLYMALPCRHKGRNTGKLWKDIYEQDYNYFLWSVANLMPRDGRMFQIFASFLKPNDYYDVMHSVRGSFVLKPDKRKLPTVPSLPPSPPLPTPVEA